MHRDLLFPPGATRHDWVLDAALAAGLGLLTVPPYGVRGFASYSTTGAFLFAVGPLLSAVLMIGSLVLRRHSPFLALAGVTLAGLLQLIVTDQPMATLVAVPVVAYSVARWIPGQPARLVVVIGSFGSVLGPMRWVLDGLGDPSLRQIVTLGLAWFVCMGLVITPYAVGRRVRESSEAHQDRVAVAEALPHRAARARADPAGRVEGADADRPRTARHRGPLAVGDDRPGRGRPGPRGEEAQAATEALTTIAETGRGALECAASSASCAGRRRADAPTSRRPRLTDIRARRAHQRPCRSPSTGSRPGCRRRWS